MTTADAAPPKPKEYIRPMPATWWLHNRHLVLFMIRELTSVFVAWSVVFLLLLIHAVSQGSKQYQQFLNLSSNPWMLALNVVTLAFVVFHAITWFNLAPQAMVVHVGRKRLPAFVIAATNYAAFIVVSAMIFGLLLIRW